jgi:hypothetical protein
VEWKGLPAAQGVSNYNVYLLLNGEVVQSSSNIPVSPGQKGTANFYNLLPGTQYQALVAGVWDVGGGEWREGKAAAKNVKTKTPAGKAPAGVKAAADSPTSLTVTWNAMDAQSGVRSYKVYLLQGGRFVGVPVSVPASRPRSVTFDGLAPNTPYQIKIAGVTNTGEGKAAAKTVRTPGPAPASLKAAAASSTSVRLTWNPVAHPAVSGYRITRTVAATKAVETIDITKEEYYGSNGGWTDTGLATGKAARYTVAALWDELPGAASRAVAATPR